MTSFAQSLGKFLRYVSYTIITIFVVVFAISNRGEVALGLFPFAYEVRLPVFLLVFISFIIGLISGNFSLWLSRFAAFRESKRTKERISALENEISVLENTYSNTTSKAADNKSLSPVAVTRES